MASSSINKPSREEILAAAGKTLPDVIAPGLRVLFCGINPGLYTAAVGHYFARPGNRFWSALHASGFTERLLAPHEERGLLKTGYGLTNVVGRATTAAAELSIAEFIEGGRRLKAKVRRYRPKFLAVLGVGAYRTAFAQPQAQLGLQSETIGETAIWVLPNPSGLNAHYPPKDLARLFSELRRAAEEA
ncbi:MAG: G/U mismatch-specific DNA glycosylase [Pyrinomonadaceae bacterium]